MIVSLLKPKRDINFNMSQSQQKQNQKTLHSTEHV